MHNLGVTASKIGMFCCSNTWDSIWVKKNVVNWWALDLFHFLIPKQAFIKWLAMRDALSTSRKLLSWGFQGDVKCIFYRHVIEDRNHLFFACGYGRRIWQQIISF